MKMNITAIYGSPRRNQNSDILLDKALEAFGSEEAAVTRLYASKADIKHCTGCEGCYKTGRCVIGDEMQQVYALFDQADIVITATPVYFHTVTSDLKKLIDRCQAIWASKYMTKTSMISKKPRLGYIFCTGGAPEAEAYFDCTVKVLDLFYKCINTTLAGEMLVADVDKVHVKEQADTLKQAFEIGQMLKKKFVVDSDAAKY